MSMFHLLSTIGSGGGGGTPAILVDGAPVGASVSETASIGALVGVISVTSGSGTYAFTLTDDAGGLFALDVVDDTRLEVAGVLDYETSTSHQVTVEADNGVDAPISRIVTIAVTDVVEATGLDQQATLLLTGGFGWA